MKETIDLQYNNQEVLHSTELQFCHKTFQRKYALSIACLRFVFLSAVFILTANLGHAQSDKTEIRDFKFPEQTGDASINDRRGTVDIEVEFGTDVRQLVAEFRLSKKATAYVNGIEQKSKSTVNDFTNPVVYTVVAENGVTTQDWIVTVTIEPSSETDFLSYSFPEQTQPAEIDLDRHRM